MNTGSIEPPQRGDRPQHLLGAGRTACHHLIQRVEERGLIASRRHFAGAFFSPCARSEARHERLAQVVLRYAPMPNSGTALRIAAPVHRSASAALLTSLVIEQPDPEGGSARCAAWPPSAPRISSA
jgi:hypothetical protein